MTFAPVNSMVEAQRVVKDPSEVENIREAVRVAERAFRMFSATLREADTEKDMVDALEGYVRRAGGRGTSFPPIVAVGERAALPHAPPTDQPLGEGSKLLVDWGADLLYKSRHDPHPPQPVRHRPDPAEQARAGRVRLRGAATRSCCRPRTRPSRRSGTG